LKRETGFYETRNLKLVLVAQSFSSANSPIKNIRALAPAAFLKLETRNLKLVFMKLETGFPVQLETGRLSYRPPQSDVDPN
jgi:hypothetical protein